VLTYDLKRLPESSIVKLKGANKNLKGEYDFRYNSDKILT